MMRRHLLTLFALFTGIAALHAPAHASSANSFVFDSHAFARMNEAAQNENCGCEQRQRECVAPRPERASKQPQRRVPAILRPPVIFGAERALE